MSQLHYAKVIFIIFTRVFALSYVNINYINIIAVQWNIYTWRSNIDCSFINIITTY